MTLAAILAVYILSLGWLSPSVPSFLAPVPQPQDQPVQSSQASQQPASSSGQTQNSINPAQQPPKPRKQRKKTVPDCANSSSAVKPAADGSSDSKKPADVGLPNSGSGNSATTSSTTQKPCPPPKKVVRNGGTDEPTIKLTGETTAAQASQRRASTDQLNASTEENLKKIADRQLAPSQQEIVTQIQQFVEQSKQAVAAGDLERAHNLALKGRLLSDELLKP
jgi:hypothetical protein